MGIRVRRVLAEDELSLIPSLRRLPRKEGNLPQLEMGVEHRTVQLQAPGEIPIAQGGFPHPEISQSQFVVGLRGLGSDLEDVSEGQDRLAVPLLSEERISAPRVSQKPALGAPRRGDCKDGQGQGSQ